MAGKVRAFIWLLTVFFFANDLYLWGGLKLTPRVGETLVREASFDAPLAATYLVIGEKAVSSLGRSDAAREHAARRFPEIVAHPEVLETFAVPKVLRAQGAWDKLCYYLAPLLLLLSLVLHTLRQKKIRSLGTK